MGAIGVLSVSVAKQPTNVVDAVTLASGEAIRYPLQLFGRSQTR